MANALYDHGRESFLRGEIRWVLDQINLLLVDTTAYTVDLANDQYLPAIPAPAIVATSAPLVLKTAAIGIADAADVLYPPVTGPTISALVLFQDTGIAATSRLIAYYDNVIGLPLTPTGLPIAVSWPVLAPNIFEL